MVIEMPARGFGCAQSPHQCLFLQAAHFTSGIQGPASATRHSKSKIHKAAMRTASVRL